MTWRDDSPGIALEVVTDDGTFYLPLQVGARDELMVPVERKAWHHLTPDELRSAWPHYGPALTERLLTKAQVDSLYPQLRRRRAPTIDVRSAPPKS